DRDLPLAELLHIDGGAERTTDEALDFLGATTWRLPTPIAVLALLAIGARMHLVLRRDPAFAFAFHPRRHLRVDRRGAEDDGMTGAIKHRAFGITLEADGHLDVAEDIELAAVGAPNLVRL